MSVPASATFALAVALKPISANAKSQQSRWYTRRLQEVARAAGLPLLAGPLYARVIWFRRRREHDDVDADNIPKRILDALKGIVFENDDEIDRCLAIKTVVTAAGDFELDLLHIPSQQLQDDLRELLGAERHVLYIEIGPVTDATIAFGPVR